MENLDNPTTPGREEVLQFIITNFMALCNVAEVWSPELEKHPGWRKLKQNQFDLAEAVGIPALTKKGEELRQAIEGKLEEY